jgi:hypothetical protein
MPVYNNDCVTGATLTFEVDLINIGDTPPPVNVFKEIDADKDLMLSREEVREFDEALPFWLCVLCTENFITVSKF